MLSYNLWKGAWDFFLCLGVRKQIKVVNRCLNWLDFFIAYHQEELFQILECQSLQQLDMVTNDVLHIP